MKPTRRLARETALQLLYLVDLNPEADEPLAKRFIAEQLHFPALEAFCWALVDGARRHRDAIDAQLAAVAQNWSIRRMAVVDRNVLRLAVYEMRFADERTPPKVAINEALEVCKKFSSAESTAFVNGILDRIAGLRQAGSPPVIQPVAQPAPAAALEPAVAP